MRQGWNEQVLFALAIIAWADGELAPEEEAGIVRAAEDAGLEGARLEEFRKAIHHKRELDDLHLHRLSALDRIFLYGTGLWLARLDGVDDPGEQAALAQLASKLMLSARVQAGISRAVEEAFRMPGGDDPHTLDLIELRDLIERRQRAGWPGT